MAILVVIACVSCNKGAESGTQTDDSSARVTDENGNTVQLLETLAGKTPLKAYRDAEEYLTAIDNYELVMDSLAIFEYESIKDTGKAQTFFKVNGDCMYSLYTENDEVSREQWYVDEWFYYDYGAGKERVNMPVQEYKDMIGMPTQGGILIELTDKYFEDAKFEKISDTEYAIKLVVSAEDYKEYSGVKLDEDPGYHVYFDENGMFTGFYMNTTQSYSGGYKIQNEIKTLLKNVGKVADVAQPDDADDYRIPPEEDSLDFSEISSLDDVSVSDTETDYVMIDVEGYGKIVVRLFENVAPKTVANFRKLVSDGFYNGLTFHRVVSGFMIQGGCPNGDGTGGRDEKLFGEFAANGFTNNLLHKRGVISMARSREYNSASTQFFIMHKDTLSLDGNYASFGFVVYGLDVVDKIAGVECDGETPKEKIVINEMTFVTVNK